MRLHEYQQLLVANLNKSSSPLSNVVTLPLKNKVEIESWVRRLRDSVGFKVTCDIQRWWRSVRIKSTTWLTCKMLGSHAHDAVLENYLDASLCQSLYILQEAQSFLQYVVAQDALPLAIRLVAEFELELMTLRMNQEISNNAKGTPAEMSCISNSTQLVLSADVKLGFLPRQVFTAFGNVDAEDRVLLPVVMAANVARFWRTLEQEEYQLLQQVRDGGGFNVADIKNKLTSSTIEQLCHEGILVAEVTSPRAR